VHAIHLLRALVQGARQAILEGRYGAFRATYLEKFHSGETLAKASA
jgi:queuine/archaeosine tRNA-ribosyltransferase